MNRAIKGISIVLFSILLIIAIVGFAFAVMQVAVKLVVPLVGFLKWVMG